MKQIVKHTARAAILCLLCILFVLTACQQNGVYKRDIDTKEIATALKARIPSPSAWIDEDQSFIEEYFQLPDYVRESSVYYAQNTNNLDEFGIFEVENGQAEKLHSLLVHSYLQKRYSENQEWYNSYMPIETAKLRDAEVRVYGNCVAYAILSAERRADFFAECEKLLKNEE